MTVNDILGKERVKVLSSQGLTEIQIVNLAKEERKKLLETKTTTTQTDTRTPEQKTHGEYIKNSDDVIPSLVRGSASTGLRLAAAANYVADKVGFDLLNSSQENTLKEQLNVLDTSKEKISRSGLTKERLTELAALDQNSQNATGVTENLAAGAEKLVDIVSNPSEITLQGVTETIIDPLNAISFGAGGIAAKVAKTVMSKTAIGATAGAVEGAIVNSATEYAISKGSGSSDEEAQKIALQSAGAGAAAGAPFGAGGAIATIPNKPKLNLENKSVKEILDNDLLNVVEPKKVLSAEDQGVGSKKAVEGKYATGKILEQDYKPDFTFVYDNLPAVIKDEDIVEIDSRINQVQVKYAKGEILQQDYNPDFTFVYDNLPAKLRELVEVEIIDPIAAKQIEYKSKLLQLAHKDIIYSNIQGWSERVGQDVIDAINAKKINEFKTVESDAVNAIDQSTALSESMIQEGALPDQIKEVINKKFLPTVIEKKITSSLNDNQPIENRYAGVRLRELTNNTLENLGEIDTQNLAAKLDAANVQPEFKKAVLDSIVNKDINILDSFMSEKLTQNLQEQNQTIKQDLTNNLQLEHKSLVSKNDEALKQQSQIVDEENINKKRSLVKKFLEKGYEFDNNKLVNRKSGSEIVLKNTETYDLISYAKKKAKEFKDQEDKSLRFKKYSVIENIDKDISYDMAYNAHRGTSFSPEQRAKTQIESYVENLTSTYENLLRYADTPEKIDLLNTEFARYKEGYTKRYKDYLGRRNGLVSTMIAGRSNFPVRQMEKKNNSIDNAMRNLIDFEDKVTNKIRSKLNGTEAIRSDDADAIIKLKKKIETLENNQQKMKDANKIIRSNSNQDAIPKLLDLGFTSKDVAEMLTPYLGKKGFQSFSLTNNNANIKRNKLRLKQLEDQEIKAATAATPDIEFEGATIHENYADKRLQILFEGKPEEKVRTALKSRGFRWSPKNGAWQRLLNSDAAYYANMILEDQGFKKKELDSSLLEAAAVDKYTQNEKISNNFENTMKNMEDC